jgi:hypothetical protein
MSKAIYKNNWISIYKGFHKPSFRIGPASYFDDRAHIHLVPTLLIPLIGIFFTGLTLWSLLLIPFIFFGYGQMFIDLPIRSGIDECDYPEYGFYLYGEYGKLFTSFWWCWGMEKKCFHMPWEWDWVRTSNLKKDGTWEHETKGNRKDFYKDEWQDIIWKEEYPYIYKLKGGKIQERIATVKVEEREWRWRGFKWLPYPKMIHKDISVEFSYGGPIDREVIIEKNGFKLKKKYTGEVGERTGSWKGGTLGCGYSMLPGESPEQTLRRMEKERVFN